jgi:hypothetical protein
MTLGVVIVTVYTVFSPYEVTQEFPPVLSNAFFLIVGFYFSRTNHQSIGGIGPKANLTHDYTGR